MWRAATPLVLLVSGALFVVSAESSAGTDLRPGRYADLASLVRAESLEAQALQDRVNELAAENERLSNAITDDEISGLRERSSRLEDPAGFRPVSGPGLTVVLKDSPEEVMDTSDQPINLLVVHQQDIQTVVNTMWEAGARALTIQGQRVITTTGIKCAGNAVRLHGIPYSQPYVISAVGDPDVLQAAIDADPDIDLYRSQAAQSDIQIGWEMYRSSHIVAPPYDGPTTLNYAEPVRS